MGAWEKHKCKGPEAGWTEGASGRDGKLDTAYRGRTWASVLSSQGLP